MLDRIQSLFSIPQSNTKHKRPLILSLFISKMVSYMYFLYIIYRTYLHNIYIFSSVKMITKLYRRDENVLKSQERHYKGYLLEF